MADIPDDPDVHLNLWGSDPVPRVTIDRLSNASNLFHNGRLQFKSGCGLWFTARGDQFDELETALAYLQDAGLGGLRGTGYGAFVAEPWKDVAELPIPQEDDAYFVNLARFAPNEAELQSALRAPAAAYKLTTVGGWCQDDAGHPWRRKRVRLVDEGAYLGWIDKLNGQFIDVTPDDVGRFDNGRRVYRCGLAFPISTR